MLLSPGAPSFPRYRRLRGARPAFRQGWRASIRHPISAIPGLGVGLKHVAVDAGAAITEVSSQSTRRIVMRLLLSLLLLASLHSSPALAAMRRNQSSWTDGGKTFDGYLV